MCLQYLNESGKRVGATFFLFSKCVRRFVLILIVGFAYVWVKGDLDWVRMKLKYGEGRYSK